MKRLFIIGAALAALVSCAPKAQQVVEEISFDTAKFSTGFESAWLAPAFDDSQWAEINIKDVYEAQGYEGYDGYSVYRFTFDLPELTGSNKDIKLMLNLAKIDDMDWTFVNGKYIGGMNTGFHPNSTDVLTYYDVDRHYYIDGNDPALNWGGKNVIAIRVIDNGEEGGMWDGPVSILSYPADKMPETNNHFNESAIYGDIRSIETEDGMLRNTVTITNMNVTPCKGQLVLTDLDTDSGKSEVLLTVDDASIGFAESFSAEVITRENGRHVITAALDGKVLTKVSPKYILTPAAPAEPRINGPKVYGVRPGSPVIFKIPASGDKPIRYEVEGLPEGLALDAEKGVISGSIATAGQYDVKFVATNDKGSDNKDFSFIVGDKMALTPPLGWNSWNCWGLQVSQDRVRESAQGMIDSGLIDYGWTYINIDDAWEAPERAKDGRILTNEKFPDIKALGDWLHSNGLKMGIYSSPGDLTCGKYLGSLGHEAQDAETYAEWGIDYLKYDWCGYGKEFDKIGNPVREEYMRPYVLMGKILREQNRDILYSLCQYGMDNVWEWGAEVDANCWRTTGDITDTWNSLFQIGFNQTVQYPYAGPGHWNDPDMMIVGKVGWGSLHESRLTPDEQYTHVTLWSLLSSPLLIGCDMAQMDKFTIGLLSNAEVIGVNQDVLGKQAQKVWEKGDIQIWMKDVEDGKAIGIFNIGADEVTIKLPAAELGIKKEAALRDLWRQKDLSGRNADVFTVPSHGCYLIKAR